VTSRGNAREAIFRDELDYLAFLRMLAPVVSQCHWSCYAFCLMPNHYHLLLATPDPTISRGMHLLNGRYARRFNVRHDRVGHLFQGRYHAEPVVRDEHLLEVCRYIALNPVRAGLCADARDWPWAATAARGRSSIPARSTGRLGVNRTFRSSSQTELHDCNLVETRLQMV
jgi:putative transposase